MCSSFKRTSRTRVVRMAGAVRGGRPSSEPSFTSLQQTLTARPRSAHQAREQSLSVGECDRVVDITPLTVWPLTFMLAHKAVPHGCRHLLFTSMCSTIPTSPDSGLTSRCSWTAKANPPLSPSFSLSPPLSSTQKKIQNKNFGPKRCPWTVIRYAFRIARLARVSNQL